MKNFVIRISSVIIEYLLKVNSLENFHILIIYLDDKLYIVMELIAGSSLQDYLSLLKETNRKMIEDNIWRVFVQLILALRYLHKEKGIVHRDLTANNIMLDDEYRVKISMYQINSLTIRNFAFLADFGLAKLRDNDCSKMTSVVGTLYYACPEIVQHTPYNEKAGWFLETISICYYDSFV